jgi:hypothetical protein
LAIIDLGWVRDGKAMSALPPIADMCGATRYVRFVPEADIQEFGPRQKKNPGTLPGAFCLNGELVELIVDADARDIFSKLFRVQDSKTNPRLHRKGIIVGSKICVEIFTSHYPVVRERVL